MKTIKVLVDILLFFGNDGVPLLSTAFVTNKTETHSRSLVGSFDFNMVNTAATHMIKIKTVIIATSHDWYEYCAKYAIIDMSVGDGLLIKRAMLI